MSAEFPELLPRALTAIEKAIELAPGSITLQGTKGSLLIELGRVDEGEALLQKVAAESESENDLAYCAHYLAVARLLKGERAEGARLFLEARIRYPKFHGAQRLEKRLLAETARPT